MAENIFSPKVVSSNDEETLARVKAAGPRAAIYAKLRAYDIKGRYNTFGHRHELQVPGNVIALTGRPGYKTPWVKLDDVLERTLYDLLAGHAGMTSSRLKHLRESLLSYCEQNTYDSLEERVLSLRGTWDGKKRMRNLFIKGFGALPTRANLSYGNVLMLGLVGRALSVNSPCKMDYMPIVIDRQGAGKSSGIKELCLEREFLVEAIATDNPKLVIESTEAKHIVEYAELAGLAQKDVEHFKAFMTREIDMARLSYGRTSTENIRRFVLIGTSNRVVLQDVTGNRRFLTIDLTEDGCTGINIPWIKANREQLYAEALYRWEQGWRPVVPDRVEREAEINKRVYRSEDSWDMVLKAVIQKETWYSAHDLVMRLEPEASRRDRAAYMRLSYVASKLGFTRRIKNGLAGYQIGDSRGFRTWEPENMGGSTGA